MERKEAGKQNHEEKYRKKHWKKGKVVKEVEKIGEAKYKKHV